MEKVTDTLILCGNSHFQPGGNSNTMSVLPSVNDIIEPMWSVSILPKEMILQRFTTGGRYQHLSGVLLSKYFFCIRQQRVIFSLFNVIIYVHKCFT